MAIAAGLWTMAPSNTASAATTSAATADVSDHELLEIRDRMTASRQATTRFIAQKLYEAAAETEEHVEEARQRMELVVTWGYTFEALILLDPSTFEPAADEPEPEPEPESGRARRLDYSSDTSDPLAGLL